MSEDLETRLERLARLSTNEPPPVDELVQRGRRQSVRRARLGIAAVLALVAAGALAGVNARRSAPAEVAARPAPVEQPGTPSTERAPIVDDGEPINGPGGTVGWVERQVWDAAAVEGPPLLDIGTGAVEVRGFEVLGVDGALVGYYVPGPIGFLALDRTSDPVAVDELVEANAGMSQAEAQQLFEEMRDAAGEDGGVGGP